ncbi:hypothetical protein D3C81_1622400 [compost metagenome]
MITKNGKHTVTGLELLQMFDHSVADKRLDTVIQHISGQKNNIRLHPVDFGYHFAQMTVADDIAQMQIRRNGDGKRAARPDGFINPDRMRTHDRAPGIPRAPEQEHG